MTKEALKLALEALEAHADIGIKSDKAITAIKEALAQQALDRKAENARELGLDYEPEQEKTVCPFCTSEWVTAEQHDRKMDRLEQEPVAWHTEDHLTDRSATTYSKDMVYRWECKGWPVTPLYTTPPQRKPLSDEEIGAILEGVNAYGTRLYTFARAIEAKLRSKNGY